MTDSKLKMTDKVIISLAIIALIFSFTTRFDFTYTRFIGAVWNLGHVVAFFIWTYLLLRFSQRLQSCSLFKQTLITLLAAASFGLLIELAQLAIGRSAQVGDIISDLLGSLLAILTYSNRSRELASAWRVSAIILLISITLFMHQKIFLVPLSDYYTYQQFPVLIDPQTPFEKTKFKAKKIHSLKLVNDNGKHHFDIVFSTAGYSTVMIGFFPLDWSEYDYLEIALVNPETESLPIVCRIHDLPHIDNGYAYSDRFSRSLELAPGENRLKIPLSDIVNAPAGRKMDLQRMASIGLFTVDSDKQRQLHLYKIQLRRRVEESNFQSSSD